MKMPVIFFCLTVLLACEVEAANVEIQSDCYVARMVAHNLWRSLKEIQGINWKANELAGSASTDSISDNDRANLNHEYQELLSNMNERINQPTFELARNVYYALRSGFKFQTLIKSDFDNHYYFKVFEIRPLSKVMYLLRTNIMSQMEAQQALPATGAVDHQLDLRLRSIDEIAKFCPRD